MCQLDQHSSQQWLAGRTVTAVGVALLQQVNFFTPVLPSQQTLALLSPHDTDRSGQKVGVKLSKFFQ